MCVVELNSDVFCSDVIQSNVDHRTSALAILPELRSQNEIDDWSHKQRLRSLSGRVLRMVKWLGMK